MQGQWAGGKGSKERISDYKTYTSNYDKIFNKEKEMTAVMNWDVYSDPYERGGVDLLEGETIQYQKVSGGFEITLLEEFPGCASICITPLFYITKDISLGKPETECIA